MNLLTDKINIFYFKYLYAAFGSAMIVSIYSVIDMAIVGQYQGPSGTAALAVVAPIWNIIYSLGLLMGIGGSVIFSILRGKMENNTRTSNEFFSTAIIGSIILSILTWITLSLAVPNWYIRLFMNPTEHILQIAPAIIRTYSISFLLLPLNIFATYYFQAIVRLKAAFIVSVLRGLVISSILLLVLPSSFGGYSIWITMPITELIVAIIAIFCMIKYTPKINT